MSLPFCLPSRLPSAVLLLAGLAAPLSANATLGIFEHGAGIQSMGWGGVTYAMAGETTALSANPAHAAALGNRYDIGFDAFAPLAKASYEGNAAGPDERYLSNGRSYYLVPQGGVSWALSERWAAGLTMFSAGLGPDYAQSPYQRFGGAPRAHLYLGSMGIATALSYKLTADHVIGASLNLGYQVLDISGLEFITGASQAPDQVTNQGKDDAFSIGFSLGWRGQLTPQLAVGAGYRSKSWTQKHKQYQGLLPEGGLLELPAIYGAGVAYALTPAWTLAFDYQRYENEAEKAFGNRLSQFEEEGHPFGSDDGPGFGFANQNAYKFGVAWQANPKLVLRAGYVHATQAVRRSETLFAFFGCITPTTHYTAGTTYVLDQWELSGLLTFSPREEVQGRDSIPDAFGGGEANISNELYAVGFSLGRRFGP